MKSFAEIKAEMEKEWSVRDEARINAPAKPAKKQYAKRNVNAICPRCHTRCYGDCQN